MSSYKIISYCPDRHIEYDGRTPYEIGVGGGVTARVRMAKALRKLGHQVTMVVNCPRKDMIDGVEYVPLDQVSRLRGDVLILNTSGGDLDLRPALELDIDVSMRIVWSHGTIKPLGLEETGFDYLYAVSNFVAGVAHTDWGVPREKLFVTYNGYEEDLYDGTKQADLPRDPYRLIYFSHPSKGLDSAMGVVRKLRQSDSRFHLEVYGGPQLWGGNAAVEIEEEGIQYLGLVGQIELTKRLLTTSYALQLQAREEPFGLTVVEAMRAGSIPLVSNVGALMEIVTDGWDGYVIPGPHESNQTQDAVANKILHLVKHKRTREQLRIQAHRIPWTSKRIASAWVTHWNYILNISGSDLIRNNIKRCPCCFNSLYELPDGLHCFSCGNYSRYH